MKYICILLFLFSSLLAKAQQLAVFKPKRQVEKTNQSVIVLGGESKKQSKTYIENKNKQRRISSIEDINKSLTQQILLYDRSDVNRLSLIEGDGNPLTQQTLLYSRITRRFSWLEGVGKPITQEEANHLPCYYKFSKKNAKGHWQHIQAMHGKSLTTNHDVKTYIIDAQHDNSSNLSEWRKRFAEICQWYITSDLAGDNVVEERAYDKNGYMIYGFQPIKNGNNRIVASYTDGYGYPIEIDENSNYTYGNVVMVTYNKNGNDSIVDYLDGAGLRRMNNDSVDQRRYEYDAQGRLIKKYSCNAAGDKMIDNWGNCGLMKVYDANGKDYTVTIIDTDDKPMRMPGKRAGDIDTFICCKYKFDKWNRLQERTYLDENRNPATTLNGIHRIEYIYSDTGKLLSEKHYDLKENLIKKEGESYEKQ